MAAHGCAHTFSKVGNLFAGATQPMILEAEALHAPSLRSLSIWANSQLGTTVLLSSSSLQRLEFQSPSSDWELGDLPQLQYLKLLDVQRTTTGLPCLLHLQVGCDGL